MNSESGWAQAAQQFQQNFGEQWAKTLRSFSGLAPESGLPSLPQISFDSGKLQALQQAYVNEAAELWNNGLGARPAGGDKRFASDAWASNPVASF
jgi:polyhydroxyalkanoate synthase